MSLIGRGPVLDVGCGDGDLAFFLESLGSTVRAIDYGPTNHNQMRGVRTLKTALNSSVEIYEADLDSQFRLADGERYSAVFLLGLLYHLKNPFYVLEMFARHTAYCFLSTRVARFTPDRSVNLTNFPVAYLLKTAELNADSTNYWIFSEAGLREICARTNWDICDYSSFGDRVSSDPVTLEGDERAFCLLKSRLVPATPATAEFTQGWHAPEAGGWRWTEKRFVVVFDNPAPTLDAVLTLRFWLPDVIVNKVGAVTLTATAGAFALPARRFEAPGMYSYEAPIPAAELTERVEIAFKVDKGIDAAEGDGRELGLAVVSVEFN